MRDLWPPAEAAQADYESLRAAVLDRLPLMHPAASRFMRGGLVALITRPLAEPDFLAVLSGARRPAWTPHDDPRLDVLVASYHLLLRAAGADDDMTRLEVVE